MSHWWSACRSTGTSWPGKFPRLVTQVTEGYNIWCDLLGFSIISKQKYQLTGLLGIHFRCWRFCISIMVPIRSNRDLMSHYWNYCRWWWLRIPEWGLTSLGSFLDRWISLISYDFIWAWNGAKTGDPWGPLNPLNIPERMVPLICWKALCPNWLNDSGGESNSIVIIFNGWMNNEDSFICTPRDHHQRQPFANNIFKKKIKGSYLNLSSKPLPTETMHQNYWTNLGCTSTSGNQELLLVFSECINAISLQTKDLSKGGRIGTGSTLGL